MTKEISVYGTVISRFGGSGGGGGGGSGVVYTAGDGIIITNREISLDDLILDCGTSTTNV